MLRVAVRYWLACRTIRSRIQSFAHPVSTNREAEEHDRQDQGDDADDCLRERG
jgi:hypothetical protein